MSGAAYDQNLLHDAPELSKAQRQEGYTLDLLSNQSRGGASPAPPQGASPAAIPTGARAGTPHSLSSDPEAGFTKERHGTGTTGASLGGAGAGYKGTSRVPFWRTSKGIIGLAVLAVVILGVVVGAAVGVTQHNKHNNNLLGSASTSGTATATATGTPDGGQSQGVGGGGQPVGGATPTTSVKAGENGGTSTTTTRVRGGAPTQEPVPIPVPTTTPGTGTGDGGTQDLGLNNIANGVSVYGADQAA